MKLWITFLAALQRRSSYTSCSDCTLDVFPFVALLSFGDGGGGVAGDGGTETPATASKDTAASALPGPAHCIPKTGKEAASSAMEDGAPEKKGLLWACHSIQCA